ncbi:Na+/H+ antiporter subunit C [Pseudoxanthomonas dokdonensis]|uniref:NADH-ubiquinone oxidoreductase subunit 4L n=1 Tax=Pseudoxanthomonas dokdonensis TaxID=344882 RepID=A0A0R0CI54_9GAMM|nr:Na+/H+ antiporter subunit C [Pseudoxanthomonas dokdonensis]KRG69581.1 NADH-ubiquinone oxidoreductase subunit 4L [Pseudoxanthomonas dokdonensis]
MELAMASAIGILTAGGIYLLLRARSFDVILGLTLLSYATNLLIFSAGRLFVGKAPVLREGVAPTLDHYVDPLPQALVLTAIVIAFAMTAVTLVMAIRSRGDNLSDHVDGRRNDPASAAPQPVAASDAGGGSAASQGGDA